MIILLSLLYFASYVESLCPAMLSLQSACICTVIPQDRINLVCSGEASGQVIESIRRKAQTDGVALKIQNLVVTDGYIPQLFFNAFAPLRVETITIQNSQLLKVHPGAFAGLEDSLKHLSLENNLISELPVTALEGLTSLELLNLACNNIPDLITQQDVIPALPRLRQINLSCNRICSMTHLVLQNVRTSLNTVLLDNNCLKKIPGQTFNGMPNLAALSLANNNIERLKSFDLVDLPSLKIVRLNGNNIQNIDQLAFASLPQLEHLILSANKLRRVEPGVFNQMKSLRTLDLSRNELTEFPVQFFAEFSNLQSLNVSGNFISELNPDHNYVRVQSSLNTLDLSHNCVGTITKASLADFSHLGKLSLANNNIHTIEDGALGQNLQEVDISTNLFDDENALKTFSSNSIIFRENPIVCSLGVHYMRNGRGVRLLRERDRVCTEGVHRVGCPTRPKIREDKTCCKNKKTTLFSPVAPQTSVQRPGVRRSGLNRGSINPEHLGITPDNNFLPPDLGGSLGSRIPSQLGRGRTATLPAAGLGSRGQSRTNPQNLISTDGRLLTNGQGRQAGRTSNRNRQFPQPQHNQNLSPAQQRLKALLATGAGGPSANSATGFSPARPATGFSPARPATGFAVPNPGISSQDGFPAFGSFGHNIGNHQLTAQQAIHRQRLLSQSELRRLAAAASGATPSLPTQPNQGLTNWGQSIAAPLAQTLQHTLLGGQNQGLGLGSLGLGQFGLGTPQLPQTPPVLGNQGFDPILPNVAGGSSPFGLAGSGAFGESPILNALGLPTLDNLISTGTNFLTNLALNPPPIPGTDAGEVPLSPPQVEAEEDSHEKVNVGGNVFLIRAKEIQPH